MTNAKRDNNSVPVLVGTLDSDGQTIVLLEANTSSSNGLRVHNGTTGSDNGPTNAKRDENSVTAIMAVSEADGVTPVALYINSSGKLLMDSN